MCDSSATTPATTCTCTPLITPGDYLRKRRIAAGLSLVDVAQVFATVPRWPETERVDWLIRLEGDVEPLTVRTVSLMRAIFCFSPDVLGDLVLMHEGIPIAPLRLCRICACSEHDACEDHGGSCAWASADLCTACADPETPEDPDPDPGERAFGIDVDDIGNGEPVRGPANDDAAMGAAA